MTQIHHPERKMSLLYYQTQTDHAVRGRRFYHHMHVIFLFMHYPETFAFTKVQ